MVRREYVTMDPVIITVLLEQSSAATQVAMSIVCKQWAAVARTYSTRYKRISEAIYADCSIAISRFLADGKAHGGGDLNKLTEKYKYLERGNSIDFARAVKSGLYNMRPYCFVGRRGTRYVDWLEKHGRFHKDVPIQLARGLAIGCAVSIKQARKRATLIRAYSAVVLYVNGYGSLCWKLSADDLYTVLEMGHWLSPDTLFSLLMLYPAKKPFVSWSLKRLDVDQIQALGRMGFIHTDWYDLDTQEQADAVLQAAPFATVYIQGIPSDRISAKTACAMTDEYRFSKTQNFAVIGRQKIGYSHCRITVRPENVGAIMELLDEQFCLRCTSCHEFIIVRRG